MGRTKQSLAFQGSTIVGTVARTALASGLDGVVVVTRTALVDQLDLPTDSRLVVAFNDDDAGEMIDSIRIGLARLEPVPGFAGGCGSAGVLVIPGDMPTVSVDACTCAIDEFKRSPDRIVVATHRGRRGHPIIFPADLAGALNDIDGGLNQLPRRFPERVLEVPMPSPDVLRDIDTAADYDELAP